MKHLLLISAIFCHFTLLAQFPNIMWDYSISAPAFGSAAAADLDNDGFYEIVFTTYTNDGKVHCLNAEDGSVKWIYDIGGCGDVAPLIYDMNSDGQLDIVVNGSCNPTIFCIDGNSGTLIWSQPSGGGDSPPTVADIDQDGRPEVLFGNFNGQIQILNGEDGSIAKIIQVNANGNTIQTEPTLVDVNADGKLDILSANYFNDAGLFVWAFDYESGEPIWVNEKTAPEADFHAYHGGAIADIDNDGLLEYVIGSGAGLVSAINLEDGTDLWTIELNASIMSAITIADMDGDGELEVIFSNNDYITFDERIWVVNGADGSEEWSYPVNFYSFRGMSVSDINGNGKLDLVSGHFMGMLRVVEPYSGLIWEINLRNQFEDANAFPWFETDHQPLIADFDQNGSLDIFAVAGYGTYTPDSLNVGRAFMIEAGIGNCPEWLMFRHDVLRTGHISPEEIETACALNTINTVDDLASNTSLFPNPNTGAFTLEFDLQKESKVEVTLFDYLGRPIQILAPATDRIGHQELQLQCPNNLPSGIYFVALEVDGSRRLYKAIELLY